MITWKFKNKVINSPPENTYGFVYKITDKDTGNFYYGCKSFYSTTKPIISKKRANELYSGKGRKPKRETKVKESNWKNYISSSKIVHTLIEEKTTDNFKFEIISFHQTKQEMLLKEAYIIAGEFLQFNNKILNEWVSVKAFKLKDESKNT
jgi:hypothetical protein